MPHDIIVAVVHDAATVEVEVLPLAHTACALEIALHADEHTLAKLSLEDRCSACLLAVAQLVHPTRWT